MSLTENRLAEMNRSCYELRAPRTYAGRLVSNPKNKTQTSDFNFFIWYVPRLNQITEKTGNYTQKKNEKPAKVEPTGDCVYCMNRVGAIQHEFFNGFHSCLPVLFKI